MATDFSTRYLCNSEKRLRWTPLYFKMKTAPLIKRWRVLRRFFHRRRQYPSRHECNFTSNLEAAASHFQKNGWAFVEGILSKDFHDEFVRQWPKRWYFEPPTKVIKSYDIGFEWREGSRPQFRYSDPYSQHESPLKFLAYLRSPECEDRITKLIGTGKRYSLYSFILHSTHVGSEVIPHKDREDNDSAFTNGTNILFFINGVGGRRSGGLTLSRDNDMNDIIVEPMDLLNTCLIYDMRANFYHGFRPIENGKFRWAVGAQFLEKNPL